MSRQYDWERILTANKVSFKESGGASTAKNNIYVCRSFK